MTERRVPASVLALLSCTALASLPIFNDAQIQAHRDRQQVVLEQSQAILARAEAEGRVLNDAEEREVTSLTDEFENLEAQVQLRERVIANAANLNAPRGRQTEPEAVSPGDEPLRVENAATPGQRRVEPRPSAHTRNGGFNHLGAFALAVRQASMRGAEPDARLRNAAATTYGSEGSGADGGFAVPPEFRADIAAKIFGEDSLVARTDRVRTSGNSITMPVDMTTPWDSSGGIQVYWGNEAAAMTQSKPKLEEVTFKAHKLHCLVPVTEELLEDAPAMDSYLRRKAPEKLDFAISNGMVRGTGAGQLLGVMNSPALVTVAAEAAQTADTIVTGNISKMWSRMPMKSRANAVWLIHPDAEPQLDLLTVGQQPVYMPAGGLADAPYGRLKGRPVIPHQVCETVGDLGDIILADWNQYMTLTKIGGGRDENGLKIDVSIHLWFDQDLQAYKFTVRIGGQPWWSTTTSPRDGSSTMSPFVTLAAR